MTQSKVSGASTKLRLTAGLGALALTAAACSTSAGRTSSTGSSSSPQTLKLITWVNPPAVKALQAIDAEFEKKYPNIKVSLQTAANLTGPYQTLLQTTVDAHSADIVSWYPPVQPLPLKPTRSNMSTWQFWSTNNVFQPLNGSSWLNRMKPAAVKAETYKGNIYGMVTGSYQEGVFYNKAIFAKYHLTPPKTYSAFLADLKTLKSAHVTPLFDGLGNVGPLYLQFLYFPLMASVWSPHVPNKTLARDLESGSVKWTSPSFVKVMQREKQIAKYLEPNYAGVPWESMPGSFAQGDAAMLLDGSWDLAAIHKVNPSMQVGFFPLPGSNVAANNVAWQNNNLTFSVLRQAPNKPAAKKWLAFFASPAIYKQYVSITGISPSFTGSAYTGFSASVLGSWFGRGVHGSTVFPTLSPNNSYWDQPANWPTAQLNLLNNQFSPQHVANLYQSAWKTS